MRATFDCGVIQYRFVYITRFSSLITLDQQEVILSGSLDLGELFRTNKAVLYKWSQSFSDWNRRQPLTTRREKRLPPLFRQIFPGSSGLTGWLRTPVEIDLATTTRMLVSPQQNRAKVSTAT